MSNMNNPISEMYILIDSNVYVKISKNKALLFNTINNEYLISTNNDEIFFISNIIQNDNCIVINDFDKLNKRILV